MKIFQLCIKNSTSFEAFLKAEQVLWSNYVTKMKSRSRFGTFWNFWARAAILRKVGGVSRERERSEKGARYARFKCVFTAWTTFWLASVFTKVVQLVSTSGMVCHLMMYRELLTKFSPSSLQSIRYLTNYSGEDSIETAILLCRNEFSTIWERLFSVTVRKIFQGGQAKSKKIEKLDFRYLVFRISKNVPDRSCSARWDEQSDINIICENSRFEVPKMIPQKWSRADISGLRYFRETKVVPSWRACPIV